MKVAFLLQISLAFSITKIVCSLPTYHALINYCNQQMPRNSVYCLIKDYVVFMVDIPENEIEQIYPFIRFTIAAKMSEVVVDNMNVTMNESTRHLTPFSALYFLNSRRISTLFVCREKLVTGIRGKNVRYVNGVEIRNQMSFYSLEKELRCTFELRVEMYLIIEWEIMHQSPAPDMTLSFGVTTCYVSGIPADSTNCAGLNPNSQTNPNIGHYFWKHKFDSNYNEFLIKRWYTMNVCESDAVICFKLRGNSLVDDCYGSACDVFAYINRTTFPPVFYISFMHDDNRTYQYAALALSDTATMQKNLVLECIEDIYVILAKVSVNNNYSNIHLPWKLRTLFRVFEIKTSDTVVTCGYRGPYFNATVVEGFAVDINREFHILIAKGDVVGNGSVGVFRKAKHTIKAADSNKVKIWVQNTSEVKTIPLWEFKEDITILEFAFLLWVAAGIIIFVSFVIYFLCSLFRLPFVICFK